jgi:hypothetical protein
VSQPPIPGVPPIPGLDEQRALVKRARRESFRWFIRALMLAIISGLALRNGWVIFGVIFAALAVMGLQLSRTTRRRAAALLEKLKLLERT